MGGCGSLFVGFLCGICLYYGLLLALIVGAVVGIGLAFYECYWARGHSDNYNAVNLALGALFFRSCVPDIGSIADTHERLNLPPLTREEKAALKEKERKDGKGDVEQAL